MNITVKDFVENYIETNTLVRLWYKTPRGIGGMHEEVIDGDQPMMEHQLINSVYKDNLVEGVTDILYLGSSYTEAVNLVIKRIPKKIIRNNKLKKLLETDDSI